MPKQPKMRLSIMYIVLLMLALAGCRVAKPVPVLQSTLKEYVYVSDTVAYSVPDSAAIEALAACDSLGNVYIRQITSLQTGGHTKPEIRVKDNYITLKCKVDSAAVFVKMSRIYKSGQQTVSVPVEVPVYVDKPLNLLQRTLRTFGWIFMLELFAAVAYLIYRLRNLLNPL